MIDHIATATVPTQWGDFTCHAYRRPDGIEHLALVLGDLAGTPLVRVHSECLTGDVLGSLRCDCGDQLDAALRMIEHVQRPITYPIGPRDEGGKQALNVEAVPTRVILIHRIADSGTRSNCATAQRIDVGNAQPGRIRPR